MKILVVDDDLELLGLIGFALNQAGYAVVQASNAAQALKQLEVTQPDLAILDVNLPDLSGFELCKSIRQTWTSLPIMLLTVRNSEEDQVQGLDLGADDYLTKPFSPRTLLARVRALLRRVGVERPQMLDQSGLQLDMELQTVTILATQTVIRLTNLEFRLLQYLLANAGRTLPMERLTSHVWGFQGAGDRHMLKQLVHRLRQKIEPNPAEPRFVVTVPSIGYMLPRDPDLG